MQDTRYGADASSEGVQRDLLPIIEGSVVSTKYGNINTDHILFICSGAFHSCKPSDMLAELQGRLPIRVELRGLTYVPHARRALGKHQDVSMVGACILHQYMGVHEWGSGGSPALAKPVRPLAWDCLAAGCSRVQQMLYQSLIFFPWLYFRQSCLCTDLHHAHMFASFDFSSRLPPGKVQSRW